MIKPQSVTIMNKKLSKLIPIFHFPLVCKPRNATSLEHQMEMVTKNIFNKIHRLTKHIKSYLLDGGYVYNLEYPDHKWKYTAGGVYYLLNFRGTRSSFHTFHRIFHYFLF